VCANPPRVRGSSGVILRSLMYFFPVLLLAHGDERGLAVAPDLTLLISDEAVGTRATITGHASSR
jgi:hypothetical protein